MANLKETRERRARRGGPTLGYYGQKSAQYPKAAAKAKATAGYAKPSDMATAGSHFGNLKKAKVPDFSKLAQALQQANHKTAKAKSLVKGNAGTTRESKPKSLSTSTTFGPNRGWGGLVSPKSPIGSKPRQVTNPVIKRLNPNMKVMAPIPISAAQKAAAKPIDQVVNGRRLM